MARLSQDPLSLNKRRMSAMPLIHKREEFSEDFNVQKIQRPIDEAAEINVEKIDAYANWWMEWNDHRYRDEELCETFCEDFGEWSEEHWKACSPQIRRKLQDMLTRNGIFIQKRNIKADKALKELATSENFFPEWTTQEIMHQFLHHGVIDTRNPLILEDQEYCRQLWKQGEAIFWKGTRQQVQFEEEMELEEELNRKEDLKTKTEQMDVKTNRNQTQILGTSERLSDLCEQKDHPKIEQSSVEKVVLPKCENFPKESSKILPPTPSCFAKQLTDLEKLYSDKESKYSGELYDILSTKLLIFYDFCGKVGLEEVQYHNAYSSMLKGRARQFYYDHLANKYYDFQKMVDLTKMHFETEANKQEYLTLWRSTTLQKVRSENPEKRTSECFQIMIDTLQRVQRGLWGSYQMDQNIKDQVLNGCQGIKECEMALFSPEKSFEAVVSQIRNAIHTREQQSRDFNQFSTNSKIRDDFNSDQKFVKRKYAGDNMFRRKEGDRESGLRGGRKGNFRGRSQGSNNPKLGDGKRQKKCFICGKIGCWSTSHSPREQREGFSKFQNQAYINGKPNTRPYYNSFLAEWEGIENQTSKEDEEIGQFLLEWEPGENFGDFDDSNSSDQFLTELGPIDPHETMQYLNNQSTLHVVSKKEIFIFQKQDKIIEKPQDESKYMWETENSFFSRYSDVEFQGIMPDTGAAGVSTAGHPQVIALQRQDTSIQIDKSRAGEHKIRFGKGDAISLGTVDVKTPIGMITFHVISLNTPFLLCIQDVKRVGVKLDNLENVLIQGQRIIPIVMKYGHPWLLLHQEQSMAYCHLTESELRQLHRRFGHPSVKKLVDLLERARQNVEKHVVKELTRSCRQRQIYGKSPGRFKFKLPDEYHFNHTIIVDIVNLEGKNALQVIDEATSYQAGRFLPDMSANAVWNALRACWIDVYLGPPNFLSHDAGTNLASKEFQKNANSMGIQVNEVPVESHNSIEKIERYHAPLRRVYKIICSELRGHNVSKDMILQMALKALNDSIGPNGLVPTLLVHGTYPRMTKNLVPSPSTIARAQAIEKAMKELRLLRAERTVKDALATRNGPDTLPVLSLPLNSEVLVWREKRGWMGPYKMIAIDVDHQECVIEMLYGPTKFRSTVVKPYFSDKENEASKTENVDVDISSSSQNTPEKSDNDYSPIDKISEQLKRGRGRPKGSKNRSQPNPEISFDEINEGDFTTVCNSEFNNNKTSYPKISEAFLSTKEKADLELSLRLRNEGIITTPGKPFEISDRKEFESLIDNGVVKLEKYDPSKHSKARLFNSRFVREIKGKETSKPYEKSRMVIAAWGDDGKRKILTQSPTLQRASQRLLVAIAPSLLVLKNKEIGLWLRDISQAYTQSTSKLTRLICAKLPENFKGSYTEDTIMVIVKPLYGIPEAGTHWWATYMNHHINKLQMRFSTYDTCLLITKDDVFGLVGMQTDDTLILGEEKLSEREENELTFIAKPKEKLTPATPLLFNGCILTLKDEKIISLKQKGQAKKIELIHPDINRNPITQTKTEPKSDLIEERKLKLRTYEDLKQSYVEQRARGAYVASICQPEACFDLSVAAQVQEPSQKEIEVLNKRLKWQMNNLDRGLKYIPLSLETAKLFVFVDSSFANNQDLSSQIGFVIVLANEASKEDFQFILKGNIIHYSSTKSKRVTRSVLASEIYGMVEGTDITYALSTTLKMITDQLNLPEIKTMMCTDSYSLYECFVKLGTTKEKRLMIDIMALRQSYERRELYEIRWINGLDNPADAMTKSNPNKALESLINDNELKLRVEGWVKRD